MQRIRPLILSVVALLALGVGGWQLFSLSRGITVSRTTVQGIPVTVFTPATIFREPTIVLAHGFAGSQQMMYPTATTLARHGFTAITFDFPGHGQNPNPFTAQVSGNLRDTSILQTTLDTVVKYARQTTTNDDIALVGHSMGSAAVVEYATTHPEIGATIGISLISDRVTTTTPRNLLIATGALEFGNIKAASQRALQNGTADPQAQPATTYGDFAAGNARRLEWTPSVEHISILFSTNMMSSVTAWIGNSANDPVMISYFDHRVVWIGLVYAGGLLLLWVILGWLPKNAAIRPTTTNGWRRAVIAFAPAVLTPLLLIWLPTTWLPILVGGYVGAFFGVYGVTQWGIARLVGVPLRPFAHFSRLGKKWLLVVAITAFLLLLIGGVAHLTLLNFVPTVGRLPWLALFALLMLPYFLVDAALAHGGWGILAARVLFILSLLFGTVVRPDVGFLLLTLPLFIIFFALLALVSTRLNRRTSPLVAALVGAILFGWMLGIALPYTG